MAGWQPTQLRFQDPAGERPNAPAAPPRIIAIPIRPSLPPSNGSPADNIQFPSLPCSQLRYSEQSHSSEATDPSARLAPWLPRRSATRLPSPPIRQFQRQTSGKPRGMSFCGSSLSRTEPTRDMKTIKRKNFAKTTAVPRDSLVIVIGFELSPGGKGCGFLFKRTGVATSLLQGKKQYKTCYL